MKEDSSGLNKLRQLCDELNDRDEQLKLNASALWDIIDIALSVRDSLSDIQVVGDEDSEKINTCISELERVSFIIAEKGCKKVVHEH